MKENTKITIISSISIKILIFFLLFFDFSLFLVTIFGLQYEMRAQKRKKTSFSNTFLQKNEFSSAFLAHFCTFLQLFSHFSPPKTTPIPIFKPKTNKLLNNFSSFLPFPQISILPHSDGV